MADNRRTWDCMMDNCFGTFETETQALIHDCRVAEHMTAIGKMIDQISAKMGIPPLPLPPPPATVEEIREDFEQLMKETKEEKASSSSAPPMG